MKSQVRRESSERDCRKRSATEIEESESARRSVSIIIFFVVVVILIAVGVHEVAFEKGIGAYLLGRRPEFVVRRQTFLQQLFEVFVFVYQLYFLGVVLL